MRYFPGIVSGAMLGNVHQQPISGIHSGTQALLAHKWHVHAFTQFKHTAVAKISRVCQ